MVALSLGFNPIKSKLPARLDMIRCRVGGCQRLADLNGNGDICCFHFFACVCLVAVVFW